MAELLINSGAPVFYLVVLFTCGCEDILGPSGDFLDALDDFPKLGLNLGAIYASSLRIEK
jgi:hypothetical protein